MTTACSASHLTHDRPDVEKEGAQCGIPTACLSVRAPPGARNARDALGTDPRRPLPSWDDAKSLVSDKLNFLDLRRPR